MSRKIIANAGAAALLSVCSGAVGVAGVFTPAPEYTIYVTTGLIFVLCAISFWQSYIAFKDFDYQKVALSSMLAYLPAAREFPDWVAAAMRASLNDKFEAPPIASNQKVGTGNDDIWFVSKTGTSDNMGGEVFVLPVPALLTHQSVSKATFCLYVSNRPDIMVA